MKRNRKEEEYKAYLRRLDEYYENHAAQRALGYKPLDKPIHYGYEVYYALRDDITRREDEDIIQQLVDDYTIPMWCENPDGTSRSWEWRKGHKGKKVLQEVKPEWRGIPTYRWDRVNPNIQKWFELVESHRSWGAPYFHWKLSIPPFWLEKKVRKHYKTHYRVTDPILQQEESEIEADLWGKYYKYYVSGAYYWGNSTKAWKKINNRQFRKENKRITKKIHDIIGHEDFDEYKAYKVSDDFEEFNFKSKRDLW